MRSRTQDANDLAALHLISRRSVCPSNDDLAAAIGARTAAAGAAALKRLEATGAITVERLAGWRKVTVCEFGIVREGPDA